MSDFISRQAAIEALNRCTDVYHTNLPPLVDKEEVRRALASLPSAQPELANNSPELDKDFGECEDCISRQAAISELMEWVEKEENKSLSRFKGLFHWTGIKAMLETLPSVEPSFETEVETKRYSKDAISRQAALETVRTMYERCDTLDMLDYCNLMLTALKALPSAQPEIVRCKDCKHSHKCYGDVVMRSRGGGNIYCPLEYCSEAERRTDDMQ